LVRGAECERLGALTLLGLRSPLAAADDRRKSNVWMRVTARSD